MTDSNITIRCTSCRGISTVSQSVLGQPVECPFCASIFAAIPDVPFAKPIRPVDVPLVFPVKKPIVAAIDPEHEFEETNRTPAIGMSLLPLGLPFVWTMLIVIAKWDPLFTPGLPIGLGIGSTLLALGATFTRDWSHSTRLKAVLAIVLLAYGIGAGFFFMKKEWAEAIRKRLGRDEMAWVTYNAGTFQVKFPGKWKPEKLDPLFPDWNQLYSVRHLETRRSGDRFQVTNGPEPDELANLPDEQWFSAIEKKLATPEAGELKSSVNLKQQVYRGKEFAFTKPDGVTNLTVRIFRVSESIIVLTAEGALLTADANDVKIFFKSLYINKLNP